MIFEIQQVGVLMLSNVARAASCWFCLTAANGEVPHCWLSRFEAFASVSLIRLPE